MLGLQALLLHLLHDMITEPAPVGVLAQMRLPQLLFLQYTRCYSYGNKLYNMTESMLIHTLLPILASNRACKAHDL